MTIAIFWSLLLSILKCLLENKILGLQPRDKATMLVVNTINIFCKVHLKMEFRSQGREMLLFLANMAAVTSRANQQYNK